MKFEPVHLPADRALNDRATQTFLRHFDGCPRSGYLYQLHRGDAPAVPLTRGTAGHVALERCILACIENGEVSIPPELAKAVLDDVLSEYHVPIADHDYLREAVYRWSAETALDPSAVVACETLIVLDLEGYQVRMKVDYAESVERDAAMLVRDWKFAKGMPTQEEVARKRVTPLAGGGAAAMLMARSFQLVLYALGLRYGRPVRVEECGRCDDGSGWINGAVPCLTCGGTTEGSHGTPGKGHVEVVEPFPLAERAQRFDVEFVYPGIEDREGRMAKRAMSLTPIELDAYLESLRGLLRRVRAAEETGDWPAQISDSACGECPAQSLCPIPAELRDHRGVVNTEEEAAEAAERLDREKAEHAARQRELKAWAKSNGGALRFGRDKVQEFVASSSETIRDKDALRVAVERAVQFGEPFQWSDHVQEKVGTSFKVRTLSADELAAEAAEEVDDGTERFGDTPPF